MTLNKYSAPVLIFITMTLCSCSSEISHISQRKATSNIRYVRQYNIIELPQLVDLDIEDNLVSGSFSGNDISVEDAKSLAVANAVKTAGADVLVEPIYDITINDNTINATVRGHAAHYKNFRKPPIDEKLFGKVSSVNKKKQVVKKQNKDTRSYWDNSYDDSKGKETREIPEEIKPKEKELKVEEAAKQDDAWINREEPGPKKADTEKPDVNDRSGKLKTPCFIISYSAVAREADAGSQASSLVSKGFQGGYLWIPDYDPAGKKLYKVYIGPYQTKSGAETVLSRVKTLSSGAYIQLLR